LAPKKTHYTRVNPDPNPATIVDDPDNILRKPKKVETQASSSQLVKANSFPEELSTLEEIPFDLSFDLSLFRTKLENATHETMLDPNFIQFIDSKKVPIHPDLDKFVLDTFDKLEALTSTLIIHIDNSYPQQSVELVVVLITKVYHFLGFKSSCIISNELLGTSKY